MKVVSELLSTLRGKDVSLWVENDRLSYDAPEGALTDEDLAQIRAHKSSIIELLGKRDAPQAAAAAQPIARVDRSRPLPLSLAQQRLWFIDQLQGAATAYNVQGAVELRGSLDVQALRAALDAIVARHEVLRTVFRNVNGEPVQQILDAAAFPLQQSDVSAEAVERGTVAAVQPIATEESVTPFDLAIGPAVRGHLVRVREDQHVLLITMHHIVSDGWSLGIMIHELTNLYAAHAYGTSVSLTPLPIQYADYACWHRQWVESDALRPHAIYWKQQLEGAPALLELPLDHPRPPMQSYKGESLAIGVNAQLATALKALARRHGVTLFMTLFAAWAAFLARLSGQNDVVVGVPVANRQRRELEGLIGFFVNTLPLRVRLTPDMTVGMLLEQVKEMTLAAYSHQEAPFEKIIELVQPSRSLSHGPVFQAMFALQNTPPAAAQQGSAAPALSFRETGDYIVEGIRSARFDLSLSLQETGGTLSGGINYASDILDRSTVERWAGHFQQFLQSMVQSPSARVVSLQLLAPSDLGQLLNQFNETDVSYAGPALLHQLFEQQVAAAPDATALVFGDLTLSYAQLNRRANQLAHYLRTQGVGPDERVVVCMERSFEMVVSLLGILKAGGAYVPLDPDYPSERLQYMLEDSAPRVVLTLSAYKQDLPRSSATVVLLDEQWTHQIAQHSDHDPDATQVSERNLAYVIYTSGSTGRPKGAMNEHRGVVNRLRWMQDQYRLQPRDRVLQKTPFTFDVSAWEFFWPLLAGAQLVLARPRGHQDPLYLCQLIEAAGVTVIHFVPSMLTAFLGAPGAHRCKTLRHIVASGEELLPALQERCLQILPQARLHNLYGPTEAAIDVTYWECVPGATETRIPIGRPIANTRIYILDRELQPVPIGVHGEIHIAGTGVGRGYLNRSALTAERFIRDPFSKDREARLYKTGDVGRFRPDGNIEYLGRMDQQVKLRGFRIELEEIETQLRRHPQVRDAAVIVREDSPGDKRLVAYITHQGDAPSSEALRGHLEGVLPDYMLPSAFVRLDTLPLTSSGKLDRKSLPAPDILAQLRSQYVAPHNPTEERLAAIWAEALRLERVGVHDDFFALGGDSILSIRILWNARAAGLKLALEDLFRHPTVARLAQAITEGRITEASWNTTAPFELVSEREREALQATSDVEDAYPLTVLQAGMHFHSELHPDSAVYHDIFSIEIHGAFEREAFERAAQELVKRHPILRTSFVHSVDGRMLQVVHASAKVEVRVEDISSLSEAAQSQHIADWMTDDKRNRFDWANAPLIRFTIHLRGAQRFQYSLSFQHAILDGWSVSALQAELFDLYRGVLSGQEVVLPAPKSSYRDFVALEQQALQSTESREYWRQRLEGASAHMLPAASEGLAGHRGSQVDTCAVFINPELHGQLAARAREINVSLKALLLTAHVKVMALISGQQDVVTGVVSNGRMDEEDGDRALGLYLNSLPLRAKLTDGTWGDLARQVHGLEQEMLPHRRFPLQEILQLTNRTQLFDALFNYNHFHVYGRLMETGGLKLGAAQIFEQTNFALMVTFARVIPGDGLSLTLVFDEAVLTRDQVERIAAYYQNALRALAVQIDARHDRTTFLADSEQALLREWNATEEEYPREAILQELFEAQVTQSPDATALVCEERELTYEELNRRANEAARFLRAQGIVPDDRVAIYADRSLEMVVGVLGTLKAGGAYVPVDPSYPRERIVQMLEDATPRVILTQEKLKDQLPPSDARVVCLDTQRSEMASAAAVDLGRKALGLSAANLAYVIYTSGSTGRPKGIAMSHGALVNLISWHQKHLRTRAPQRTLQFAALGFDVAFQEIFATLCVGGTLVLIDEQRRRDPTELVRFLCAQRVERLFLPFSALQALADSVRGSDEVLPPLQDVITAGEQLRVSPAIVNLFQRLQGCRLHNHYGPTESHVVTALTLDPDPLQWPELPSIGRPIANTQIHILDANGQAVPIGVAGEIYLAGAGLARGYLNRDELTAERFVTMGSPGQVPPQRRYRTGDLGRYRADGTIEFLGRNDSQVKIRGFRVELGEIEAQLGQHEQVKEAVVVAREETSGEKRLVAYVTLNAGNEVAVQELKSHLEARVPEYMVPSAFVVLESMPLSPNGKLNRQALPDPQLNAYSTQEYEAPQGAAEELLATLWQELLHVERVGRHDRFFDLGGHSLVAVRVVARIREAFQSELPLGTFFEAPTIAGMVEELARLNGDRAALDEVATAYTALASLSDEEVREMLAKEGT